MNPIFFNLEQNFLREEQKLENLKSELKHTKINNILDSTNIECFLLFEKEYNLKIRKLLVQKIDKDNIFNHYNIIFTLCNIYKQIHIKIDTILKNNK